MPSNDPNANDPVSLVNIFAGGALNQRNPKQEPTVAPKTIHTSEIFLIFIIFKYSAKTFQINKLLK